MISFLGRHPILKMIIFNFISVIVSLCIAVFIQHKYHYKLGTVIFVESLFFLLLAYFSVSGNSRIRAETIMLQPKDTTSHLDSYAFAIKYGLTGIILFAISGLYSV